MFLSNLCHIGCLDVDIDCDKCEYCNHRQQNCRKIVCDCELPSCKRHVETPDYDPYRPGQNNAHFIRLESTAYCNDEAEAQCRDGYVYFEGSNDVRDNNLMKYYSDSSLNLI